MSEVFAQPHQRAQTGMPLNQMAPPQQMQGQQPYNPYQQHQMMMMSTHPQQQQQQQGQIQMVIVPQQQQQQQQQQQNIQIVQGQLNPNQIMQQQQHYAMAGHPNVVVSNQMRVGVQGQQMQPNSPYLIQQQQVQPQPGQMQPQQQYAQIQQPQQPVQMQMMSMPPQQPPQQPVQPQQQPAEVETNRLEVNENLKKGKKERSISKMLIAVSTNYLIGNLPNALGVIFLQIFGSTSSIYNYINVTSTTIGGLSHIFYLFIFAAYSDKYRKALIKQFEYEPPNL